MALTETDLQDVVERIKSMLPAMLVETAPDYVGSGPLAEHSIARIHQCLI